MANSVIGFEIFATDVERARKFYQQAFGWKFEAGGWPEFYHIDTGSPKDPGLTMGILGKRRGPAAEGPLNSFRNTIGVSNINDTVAAVSVAGGQLRGNITHIPDVGQVAEFTDTEGNIFCAMQFEAGHPLAAR
jgi:predicted enzyme related to lactoylglutathione lyase